MRLDYKREVGRNAFTDLETIFIVVLNCQDNRFLSGFTLVLHVWCSNTERASTSSPSVKTTTMSVRCTFQTRKLEFSNIKYKNKNCTANVFLVPFLPWNHILVPLYLLVVCKKCCYICCIHHMIHCCSRYWCSLASLPKVFLPFCEWEK